MKKILVSIMIAFIMIGCSTKVSKKIVPIPIEVVEDKKETINSDLQFCKENTIVDANGETTYNMFEDDYIACKKILKDVKKEKFNTNKSIQIVKDIDEAEADRIFDRMSIADECFTYTCDDKNKNNLGDDKYDYWDINIKEKTDKCLRAKGLIK